MSDGPPLLWALKNAFGEHCVKAGHGVTFAGEGFVVHVLRNGRVALRLAEGTAAEPQEWLLAALHEFVAAAEGYRTPEGVSVPVGQHLVHFGQDGRVRVERGGAARRQDARHDPRRLEATIGRHGRGLRGGSGAGVVSPAARLRGLGPAAAGVEPWGEPRVAAVSAHARPRAVVRPDVVPVLEDRGGKRAIVFRPQPAPVVEAAPAVGGGEEEPGQGASGEGAPEGTQGAVEALWQRWAARIEPADPQDRARAAQADRIAIRGLLEALRAEGPLHAPERRSLAVRLVALDRLLRHEVASPTPA